MGKFGNLLFQILNFESCMEKLRIFFQKSFEIFLVTMKCLREEVNLFCELSNRVYELLQVIYWHQ